MRKRTPQLEWQVVENDEEWARQQALLTPVAMPRTGYRLYMQKYAGNLLAFLLLLVIGGVWWYTYQDSKAQKRSVTGVTTPAPQYMTDDGSVGAIDGANVNQDKSAIQLLTQGVTARQSEQSLITPYFLYRFRQQDGAVVRAVAPSIDALYTTLWRDFGLPIHPTPDKLVIHVTLAQLPGQAPPVFDTRRSIRLPSPAHYLAPVTLSDADLLAQSIALPLLAHGLAEARDQHQIKPAWQPLVDGLSLWQVWELDLPLASWRETVVRWQYHDLLTTNPDEALPLPERYQELCAAHKLWLQSPLQIHIPLLCAGRNRENGHWRTWRMAPPLTTLAQLAVPSPMTRGEGASSVIGPSFFTHHPGQTVALATLVEYAVQTYGRESLPALVAGLGDADSWETLLPAVFGVSTTEFEAGWQAYLADHSDL